MIPKLLNISLLFYSFISFTSAANILYIIPYAEKSHYIMLRPIGLELARRGHNVTVITSFKETDYPSGYHQVLVDDVGAADKTAFGGNDGSRPNLFTTVDMTTETLLWKFLWIGGISLTENYLKSDQVQEFLVKDNTFDMVITEQFAQEAFHILAHKYNAPLALVATFGNCMKHNIITRNPLQLATVTFEWADIEEPTTFFGRLRNLYYSVFEYVVWKYWFLGQQEELMRKYIPNLPDPVPSLFEMQNNASLLLMNSHFSFDPPTAYLPNIVEIGGAHLTRSDSKLPNDLKKILDEATHGVVYVSLGSNIRSSELPPEKKQALIAVFGRLKQTVLWKWEDDHLGSIPKNIVTRKWMPQKDVLAHPNVKVFISHGGLIGTQEAIYNGVPIIGIPVNGDQYNNLLLIQNIGFGRILRYHDINEANLENHLQEVLKDDVYRNKAKEVSTRFKDRPMEALDTAMFWIEYVIRNKGAEYMKNPAKALNWIAANMLDVYAFVLALCLGLIFVFVKITLCIKQACTNTKSKQNIKKQKRS